jgi:hypothetical protein
MNNKYCLLEDGPFFSTDYSNACWSYPNGTWAARKEIWTNYYDYVAGYLYFLANDPSVPTTIRTGMSGYGLPADEFKDNNHWPWQMYVREGRRMQGKYVMTQADLIQSTTKSDAIAVGLWSIDSHACDLFASTANGSQTVVADGFMYIPVYLPYQLPFGAMLPNPAQVSNLAVTVCLSSSHIAFSSLRVEPTLMVLGEAAGTAAGLALQSNVDISEVDITELQNALTTFGVVLAIP